jgi:hypothetical protein
VNEEGLGDFAAKPLGQHTAKERVEATQKLFAAAAAAIVEIFFGMICGLNVSLLPLLGE